LILHINQAKATMFSINKSLFVTLFALQSVATTNARLSGEQEDQRRLGYYSKTCDDYKDLNDRCCGDNLDECKCPVREYKGWGSGYIQSKWDKKCTYYGEKVAELCVDDELGDIADVLTEKGYSTLVAAALATGVANALVEPNGPYTVFAPTDEAFAQIPEDVLQCLLLDENVDALSGILLYHAVSGTVLSTDLTNGSVTTVNGQDITVDLSEGVMINDATVTEADILASNGVIHEINSVLLPPDLDLDAFIATCP
jgi:uncharacterized surface protein with fasciclin (FAS1) repeats